MLRLARSLRFGLDLRFQAHAVLFASRLLYAIALHQASLRALALVDKFHVALLKQTQTHEASPPSASTAPTTATTRWETMLHECYVREWWLLDEAPALTALVDALLQHLLRLLALFPAVTEQTLAGSIVGSASAQQPLESGSARSLYPTSPSKSSKAAIGSKIAKDELPVNVVATAQRGGDGESGVCYGSSIALLLAAAGRVAERVCG